MSCLRLIYQSNEPVPVIVLEDVCKQGFTTIYNFPEHLEDSMKIITRLAKFHAGAYHLYEQKVCIAIM